MADLYNKSFDHNNCPSCLHHFVLPEVKSFLKISEYNEEVRVKHVDMMIRWNNESSTMRGAKPKVPQILW